MKLSISEKDKAADVIAATRREFVAACGDAVKAAAQIAVQEGRANIASAGFSGRWQSGLRSRFYRNRGTDPAALVYHRFGGIAGVFEHGSTIRGKPLLWIPVTSNKLFRRPRDFRGKMFSVNRGRRPLLFSAASKKPLFFGIERVTIRKRFNLLAIFRRAAAQLPDLLQKRLQAVR